MYPYEFRKSEEYKEEVSKLYKALLNVHIEKYKLHHLKQAQQVTHLSEVSTISRPFIMTCLNGKIQRNLYFDSILLACKNGGYSVKELYKELSK